MLKERIQEVFEFTKSESPYRKANKGWINQDIFLDLSPSPDQVKQINEDAKVTLFWSPINSLLSNIFIIFILGSLLVFTSVSFAKGRFDLHLFSSSEIIDVVEVEENNALDISEFNDVDTMNLTIQENIDKKEVVIKDKEKNTDIKISANKKSKSNFI